MFPELGVLWGGTFPVPVPAHEIFVALGVLTAAIIFGLQMRHTHTTNERLLAVVAGAFIGGAIFMRLGTWIQHFDLNPPCTPTSPNRWKQSWPGRSFAS